VERITKIGQIKKGDKLVVIGKQDKFTEMTDVDNVLHEGKDHEEILLHEGEENIYFIMSMYLDGTSWAEKVYRI